MSSSDKANRVVQFSRINSGGVTWPKGFSMREAGLYHKNQEKGEPQKICGPFYVLGLARDRSNSEWSIYLSWYDPDGTLHKAKVALADLVSQGTDCFRGLVSQGFPVPASPGSLQKLKSALGGLYCEKRVRLIDQTGWFEGAFVLPHEILGARDQEFVFTNVSSAANYGWSGSLSDWLENIAAPASGNSRLVFAISAALSGPVFALLQEEPIGVNFFGSSSTGKSTLLKVAGSVWGGGGRSGFVQSWKSTINGLEAVAKAHSDTCLCLDELAELDARDASEIFYFLINGQGKSRADRSGEARQRSTWRTLLLSSGEITIEEKIWEGGRRPKQGQSVRFADVPADAGKRFGVLENTHGEEASVMIEKIKHDALQFYGVAGPAFVEHLTDAADICSVIKASTTKLVKQWGRDGADGQVLRVARRFAMIAVCGELASKWLDFAWQEGEANNAVKCCFDAWLENRGHAFAGELVQATNAIKEMITEHCDVHFPVLLGQDPGGSRSGTYTSKREVWGYQFEIQTGEKLIGMTPKAFAVAIKGIGQPREIARILHSRGFLHTTKSEPGRVTFAKKVRGKTVHLYAFREAELFKGEEDT
ncbi:DUF927 domain-containing protein [Labrenzia sp. ac12]